MISIIRQQPVHWPTSPLLWLLKMHWSILRNSRSTIHSVMSRSKGLSWHKIDFRDW
jgi:hypothetical protein